MRLGSLTKGFLSFSLIAAMGVTARSQQPSPQYDQKLFAEMRWRCIGPFRGGRTVAISGVPQQPNVFYMAAVNGGVWKTTDFGNTWKPIFDEMSSGSVGALAVAHSDWNTIYVGSGEGLQRPDLAVGDGVYKSTDAGKTWTHLGLRDAQQITAMVIDPKNPDRVFVAAEGHPYGPNSERGVFRSLDGGKTFEKVLYKDENTGAADLVMDPANSQVLYAALWAARVAPWEVRSGESFTIPGGGLYKSTDGGTNWRPITKGLPSGEDGLGRIGIAIAPSNPKRLYVTAEAKKNGAGIYVSDDAGESWKQVNSDHRIGGRGPGAMGIVVAPDNPEVLYVANTTTWKSTDGGKTFVGFKGAPGGDDYQRIWINPENSQTIALSADQGAEISVNGGQTWSSWYNQPTAQFYHVTTDNRFPYWVYGAQQESGSVATQSRSDYGEITFREWSLPGVFEYGYIAVDPLDSNIVYGAKLTRTNQALGEVADIAPEPIRRGEYRYNRTLPVVFSPLDSKALYFAANVLFKTTDQGRNWKIISHDLTRESYEMPPNLGAFSAGDLEKGHHHGTIYAVAPSFKEVDTIWAGTDDGLVHLTRDGGKSWKNVTPPQLKPWSKVSVIEASHFEAGTAYAAINSFRLDDLRAHIYRTRDFGATWQEITAGIADNAASNVVREDPLRKGLLYAGTETSVYVSFNDGDSWQALQLNLPHTSMRDLAIHGDDLIVATHGRSFWILDDLTPLRASNTQAAAGTVLYKPRLTYRLRWPEFFERRQPVGENPPNGAIVYYYFPAPPKGVVALEFLDASGKVVRRYSNEEKKEAETPPEWPDQPPPQEKIPADAGMNRFAWDLRLQGPTPLAGEPGAEFRNRGAMVPAGEYQVRLTAEGKSYTAPLELKLDPRVKATNEDVQKQVELGRKIVAQVAEIHEAIGRIREVRTQTRGLERRLGDDTHYASLLSAAKDFDKKSLDLESQLLQVNSKSSESNLNYPVLIDERLHALLFSVEAADAAPTKQQYEVFEDLEKQAQPLLAQCHELMAKDLPALNEMVNKQNIPALYVPAGK